PAPLCVRSSRHPSLSLPLRRPPPSTLFPYTTLFRSAHRPAAARISGCAGLPFLASADADDRAGDNHAPRTTHCVHHVHRCSCSRSEEHTSELQSLAYLVCRLLLEKKKVSRHSAIHVY